VPDDQQRVIQIELHLEGSMPVGIATGPDGAVRSFTGWVRLMSAVDALCAGDVDVIIEPADATSTLRGDEA
jgi:hypothetical protein